MIRADLLRCLYCRAAVDSVGDSLRCRGCQAVFLTEGNLALMLPKEFSDDLSLSKAKWNDFYEERSEKARELIEIYRRDNFKNVYRQLSAEKSLKDSVFLEIGCGPFVLGQLIASECQFIIGVDFSYLALRMAGKLLEERGIKNYLLVLGDVSNLPLSSDSVDILYGGGVLEHFRETEKALAEFYRVVRPGGLAFNAVPYLNLGALTYRQVWGNIPNLPILKPLAEFIHIKLLRSRHLTFGYELSFTGSQLVRLHRQAGFPKVTVDKFETKLLFEYVPVRIVRRFLIYLADNYRIFWPMVKVVARK